MTAWSVVACDQFTSEPEYWARAEALVGDKPSTLRLMLPEAYLGKPQAEDSTARINAAMDFIIGADIYNRTIAGSQCGCIIIDCGACCRAACIGGDGIEIH